MIIDNSIPFCSMFNVDYLKSRIVYGPSTILANIQQSSLCPISAGSCTHIDKPLTTLINSCSQRECKKQKKLYIRKSTLNIGRFVQCTCLMCITASNRMIQVVVIVVVVRIQMCLHIR